MAIGGGRGTESAPSSPSSSPQLCIPEEEDLESVPLLRPSFLTLCKENRGTRLLGGKVEIGLEIGLTRQIAVSATERTWPDLFHSLVLWCGSAVVRVFLRAHFCTLTHIGPVLLVLVCQLLYMAVCFAAAQSPHRAGQPLAQGISRPLGSWRTLRAHHVPRLQGGR